MKVFKNQLNEKRETVRKGLPHGKGKAIALGFLMGIITFLAANASFEPITFIAFVVVGFSFVFRKRIFTPLNFFLGFMTVAGVLAHFYQNVLWFGSFEGAWADATGSFHHRTGIEGDDFTLGSFLYNFWLPIMRFERMFFIPGIVMAGLSPLILKSLKNKYPVTVSLAVVFLLAGYSWVLVMPQHSEVHPFTVKHFGIYSAVMTGPIVVFLWQKFQELREKQTVFQYPRFKKVVYYFIFVYILGMALTQQVFAVYVKYGFFHEFFK